jgi:hypothetical protein
MILKLHEKCGRSVEKIEDCKWCLKALKKLKNRPKTVGRGAGDVLSKPKTIVTSELNTIKWL